MKQHVLVGSQILAPLVHLRDVISSVRSHHERWDGFGYPDRLAGEAIPFGARIIGAVEIFDALTTSRPYQEKMPADTAIERMRDLAGTVLDPAVHRRARIGDPATAGADVPGGRGGLTGRAPHARPVRHCEERAQRATRQSRDASRELPAGVTGLPRRPLRGLLAMTGGYSPGLRPKSTVGTARSAASVISHSSDGVACARPATRLVGNCACFVLYCVAVSL